MMSEEEKKAIKYLEFLSNEKCECKVCQNAKKHYKIILNLIEKQQKEIEDLKKNSIGVTKFKKLLFSIRMLYFHNYITDKQYLKMINKVRYNNE